MGDEKKSFWRKIIDKGLKVDDEGEHRRVEVFSGGEDTEKGMHQHEWAKIREDDVEYGHKTRPDKKKKGILGSIFSQDEDDEDDEDYDD